MCAGRCSFHFIFCQVSVALQRADRVSRSSQIPLSILFGIISILAFSMASSHFENKMTKFTLVRTWSIENIDFYRYEPRKYEPLESPVFYAPEHDLQFKIFFYPNGGSIRSSIEERSKNYTGVGVQVRSISVGDIYRVANSPYWKVDAQIGIDYTVELADDRNYYSSRKTIKYSDKFKQPVDWSTDYRNIDFRKNYKNSGFGIEDSTNGFSDYCGGNLKLNCTINVSYKTDSFSGVICFPVGFTSIAEVRSEDHLEKMKALLRTGTHSDVTLVVGGVEFKVHKLHLSTHSAVFAAMFSHADTKEEIEKKVVIDDVPTEVMSTLLTYIYTGTVESKSQLTTDLLYAVDKYQVDGLKKACERQLSMELTTESAFTTLQHADLHNATTLKESCIQFVAFHSAIMMASTSIFWTNFTTSARPGLVSEVASRVVSK